MGNHTWYSGQTRKSKHPLSSQRKMWKTGKIQYRNKLNNDYMKILKNHVV